MPDYRYLDDDQLLELRATTRSVLAELELQAAQFGALHVPIPVQNDIKLAQEKLSAIEYEFKRRAGGTLPEPPELIELRAKIKLFEDAIKHESDPVVIKRWQTRLDDLREQASDVQRQHDDFVGTLQAAAQTAAVNLERDAQAQRKQQEQQRAVRERFVNRRSITLDQHLFRDRVNEQQQIMRLLREPHVRVIQVIGTGGMGKTALIAMILLTLERNGFKLNDAAEPFHAIVYRSHKDTGLTFEQVVADLKRVCPDHADTLNQLQTSGDYAQQARVLLATLADVPLVLVLDNCETLMDETGCLTDSGIAALLNEALNPNCRWRVILTSRREFQPDNFAMTRYQRKISLLEGLPFADAKHFLLDYDADNSTAIIATPDTVLKPIINRLHGRPRLLESFVGLLRQSTYTPEQLLAQPHTLDDITAELHSWLSVGERAIMRALAVFGVPAPREALDYLLLPSLPSLNLDQTLARMTRNGVINQSNNTFSLHSLDAEVALRDGAEPSPLTPLPKSGEGNNSLLPLAGEGLGMGATSPLLDHQTLHARTAAYYQQRELPREQWRTIDDLAPQIARVQHLTAAGLYDAAAEVLADIDFNYMMLWGHSQQVINLREPLQGKLTDPELQVNQANNLGVSYHQIGRVRDAIQQYQAGLQVAKEQHHKQAQGAFLGNLGNAYADLGEVRRAIDCYEQQLVIAREIGDRRSEGNALGSLGLAYYSLGEVRRAIEYHEQALVISREIGNKQSEGIDLENIAGCYLWLGDNAKARELLNHAHTIDTEIQNPSNLSSVLIEQGNLARLEGNFNQALERYQAALQWNQPQTAGKAAWLGGVASWLLGQHEQAEAYWQDAAVRCATMSEDVEYQYIAALIEVAQAVANPHGVTGDPLAKLREVVAKHPIPLRLMEAERDLKDIKEHRTQNIEHRENEESGKQKADAVLVEALRLVAEQKSKVRT